MVPFCNVDGGIWSGRVWELLREEGPTVRDGHVWTACCLTSITRHTLTRTSAINGILAMMAFKKQFATNCGSPVEPEICPKDLSIIVAILSAGTVVGALLAAPAGDSLGRRITLLLSVGVFCIGAICQVCADAVPLLLVGRYAPSVPGRSP